MCNQDRPTNDQPLIWNNSNGHNSARVIRSTSCLVRGGVFGDGGSNGAISCLTIFKMAARLPSWKIQMAISKQQIIRFTPCLILERSFRGRRIEWRYFQFDQIQQLCRRKQCARSNQIGHNLNYFLFYYRRPNPFPARLLCYMYSSSTVNKNPNCCVSQVTMKTVFWMLLVMMMVVVSCVNGMWS